MTEDQFNILLPIWKHLQSDLPDFYYSPTFAGSNQAAVMFSECMMEIAFNSINHRQEMKHEWVRREVDKILLHTLKTTVEETSHNDAIQPGLFPISCYAQWKSSPDQWKYYLRSILHCLIESYLCPFLHEARCAIDQDGKYSDMSLIDKKFSSFVACLSSKRIRVIRFCPQTTILP